MTCPVSSIPRGRQNNRRNASKYILATYGEGKTGLAKSKLVFIQHLIGREDSLSFLNQSGSVLLPALFLKLLLKSKGESVRLSKCCEHT